MIKKLEIVIEHTCNNCPYFNYDMGGDHHDEQTYCVYPNLDNANAFGYKTIANSGDISLYERQYRMYLESKKTLFPMCEKELPTNPLNIPEWCPLPNAD